MGFFSKIFKVAKIVGRAVAAYYTGGMSEMAIQAGTALTAKTPKASPVTGMTSAASTTADTTSTADQIAAEEKRRRLALNAAGGSGNTTSPLGVTSGATVTKRNLLGM